MRKSYLFISQVSPETNFFQTLKIKYSENAIEFTEINQLSANVLEHMKFLIIFLMHCQALIVNDVRCIHNILYYK